jgi:hypothetical protein
VLAKKGGSKINNKKGPCGFNRGKGHCVKKRQSVFASGKESGTACHDCGTYKDFLGKKKN